MKREDLNCYDIIEFNLDGQVKQGYIHNILGSVGYCEVTCKRRPSAKVATTKCVNFEDILRVLSTDNTFRHDMFDVIEPLGKDDV